MVQIMIAVPPQQLARDELGSSSAGRSSLWRRPKRAIGSLRPSRPTELSYRTAT